MDQKFAVLLFFPQCEAKCIFFSKFLTCLSAGVENNHGTSQRLHHGKNGHNPPSTGGDKKHQLPATRVHVPRTYHHDIQGAPGYLPGFPRQTEPRMYQVPSLQRHWGSEKQHISKCNSNPKSGLGTHCGRTVMMDMLDIFSYRNVLLNWN